MMTSCTEKYVALGLVIGKSAGKRLHGKRITVVGREARALTFKTRGAS